MEQHIYNWSGGETVMHIEHNGLTIVSTSKLTVECVIMVILFYDYHFSIIAVPTLYILKTSLLRVK